MLLERLLKWFQSIFQSIHSISKRGGGSIKTKWSTKPPDNIQNYIVQAFMSSKRSTDCGPQILQTILHPAPNQRCLETYTLFYQLLQDTIQAQGMSATGISPGIHQYNMRLE